MIVRRSMPLMCLIMLAGCGDNDRQGTATDNTAASESPPPSVQVDLGPALKNLPIKPDPAADAVDAATCERLGGEWDDFYNYSTFDAREPLDDAASAGKRCWSSREINKLADAGKPCTGQADCIGNCISTPTVDGSRGAPRCQSHSDEPPCGWIFERGKYYPTTCPPAP